MYLTSLNLLLLVASILVVRRKRLGVILSLWWAWLYPVSYAVIILLYLVSASPGGPAPEEAAPAIVSPPSPANVSARTTIFLLLFIVVEVGWPTFLVLWFARASTKRTSDA